jgi:hypothetical protein
LRVFRQRDERGRVALAGASVFRLV